MKTTLDQSEIDCLIAQKDKLEKELLALARIHMEVCKDKEELVKQLTRAMEIIESEYPRSQLSFYGYDKMEAAINKAKGNKG